MIWWLSHSTRLYSEKASLAELEGSVDWLMDCKWQAKTDLAMCVTFKIMHGKEEFAFQMIFPSVFPDAPPMIYTEDRSRISFHQYGSDGELCLEHRPDNWQSSITCADMVTSCERLIREERPETGEIVHAHSAHVLSLGRDLRSKFCRFIMTQADINAVNALTEYVPETLVVQNRKVASTFISSIAYIGNKDDPVWKSDLITPKEGSTDGKGFVARVPGAGGQGNITAEDMRALLDGVNLDELTKSLFDSDGSSHLLMGDGEKWELFLVYGDANDSKVITYKTVSIPTERQRLPDDFQTLANKKVGIVGCGSVGSKIAASLCRSGIGRFLLIDEDIFFPGNVVRNELDLSNTGAHKSYALQDRLLKLNPLADVEALRIALGGQESAESMTSALAALGDCDLLIDATAEPAAFNMIASVSTRQKKPMVWTEVFSGGIGGIVVRARPDLDPTPLSARSQIEVWCTDQGVDWIRSDNAERYEGQDEDENPLIADDAEIAIMASHATRFATDILSRPDASIFPVSAYVVGFSSQWLFEQPFDTRPIDLQPNGVWGEIVDELEPEERLALLLQHFSHTEDSNATDATE